MANWYLEAIGVRTGLLDACIYCVEQNYSGIVRLLDQNAHSERLRAAMKIGALTTAPTPP